MKSLFRKLYGVCGQFNIINMGKHNQAIKLWLDIRIFNTWYVFMWRKNNKPYMYYSNDATPPCERNFGGWIFGRNTANNY